ncbi:hypothetical protein A3J03_00330 [Candidatus Uhrbacteria bacterium RIFCSPLOWO2_02_FULL_46_25]|nr:MAG: hypothetical protein A3J03_00330 [Candidatus Uhrbacteria bacterium RIFCSPLOWO2_02_FULL_46_25]
MPRHSVTTSYPMSKKTSPKPKQPVPVAIQPHEGAHSPHVLNLRRENTIAQAKDLRLQNRIAAFDERVAEVPDLLKAHSENFAKLIETQKQGWQEGFSSFLSSAATFGKTLKGRLNQKTRHVKGQRSARLYIPIPAIFRHERVGIFFLLLVAITLPVQGLLIYRAVKATEYKVASNMSEGVQHANAFIDALRAQDFTRAKTELAFSLGNIKDLRQTLHAFGPLRLIFPAHIKAKYTALELSELTALSGKQLLTTLLNFKAGTASFSTLLSEASTEISYLSEKMRLIADRQSWKPILSPLKEKLRATEDILTVLTDLSGSREQKKILLVFQNPRELRATGGFAGSLALLTINNGKIDNVEIPSGGSYDVQGQLTLNRISPKPLHLINPRFELQDANWWPDFPTSAKKISELYGATGGPTLDGVIAITAYLGEEILKSAGPITLSGGEKFTAQNFIDQLQNIIARDRETNRKTPKRIITTLFPAVTEKARELTRSNPQTALTILINALYKKDIQIWSRDEETEAALHRLGASGALKEVSGDYLSVITSNVGGGKTDGVIDQNIHHEARITREGTILTTVTLTRTHHGKHGDKLLGIRNYSFVRMYVPKDARLISASGFSIPPSHLFEKPPITLDPDPDIRNEETEARADLASGTRIWNERGKTVFGNWLIVNPGEAVQGKITYEIPLRYLHNTITYALTIEQQAGARSKITSQVSLDPQLQIISGGGEGVWQASGWNFTGVLDKTIANSAILYRL